MRKQLLGALVATVLIVFAGALCAVVLVDPGPPGESGVLSGKPGGPGRPGVTGPPSVRSVSVPLGGRLHRRAEGRATTGRIGMDRFSQVAVIWHGTRVPRADVRIRHAGRWSTWHALEPMRDLEAGEGNGTKGSELLWVGPSDAVQVRTRGPVSRDLELVLIDPDGPAASVATPPSTSPALSLAAAEYPLTSPPPFNPPARRAPRPTIHTRYDWGADESWRNDAPLYSDTLVQAHVHHTASANGYSRAAVPGIIRGIYSYHTRTLGWSDIGYNFLVDRFGRIWHGRAGGVKHPVRGAHTLGFNNRSVGVAVIGSHQNARPSSYAVTALVRLIAWKLDIYGRRPAGYTDATSEGSDRFAAGSVVRLPVVDGHRDTNQTACPGNHLYAQLPEIRRRAQIRVNSY